MTVSYSPGSDDLVIVMTGVLGAHRLDVVEVALPIWEEVVLGVVVSVQLDDGVDLTGGISVLLMEHEVHSHHSKDEDGDRDDDDGR